MSINWYYITSLVLIVFTSCTTNKHKTLENKLQAYIIKQPIGKEFTLQLDTITSFDWEELLIAGPYIDIDKIEKDKYDLSNLPNFTKSNDKYILIGFINNKKAICWIETKSNSPIKKLLINSEGYKILKKDECIFHLKK